MPNVREELKFTDDQLATMAEIRSTLRQKGRVADAQEKALTAANEKIKSVLSSSGEWPRPRCPAAHELTR